MSNFDEVQEAARKRAATTINSEQLAKQIVAAAQGDARLCYDFLDILRTWDAHGASAACAMAPSEPTMPGEKKRTCLEALHPGCRGAAPCNERPLNYPSGDGCAAMTLHQPVKGGE
jgi:hypothetical protein